LTVLSRVFALFPSICFFRFALFFGIVRPGSGQGPPAFPATRALAKQGVLHSGCLFRSFLTPLKFFSPLLEFFSIWRFWFPTNSATVLSSFSSEREQAASICPFFSLQPVRFSFFSKSTHWIKQYPASAPPLRLVSSLLRRFTRPFFLSLLRPRFRRYSLFS